MFNIWRTKLGVQKTALYLGVCYLIIYIYMHANMNGEADRLAGSHVISVNKRTGFLPRGLYEFNNVVQFTTVAEQVINLQDKDTDIAGLIQK